MEKQLSGIGSWVAPPHQPSPVSPPSNTQDLSDLCFMLEQEREHLLEQTRELDELQLGFDQNQKKLDSLVAYCGKLVSERERLTAVAHQLEVELNTLMSN